MHFIGIDIGTSSICGAVYDLENGKLATTNVRNTALVESDRLWAKIQDPEKILNIVVAMIDGFRSKHPVIGGIGITGQMHGILYTGEEGQAVSPLYTWQDQRGELPYKEGISYAAFLSAHTHYNLSTGFGLVTHFYNLENGLVPGSAVKICTIMDYVVMRLVKRKTPLTDHTNAAGLGFFDPPRMDFDYEAIDRMGMDASILPQLDDSATLAGYYNQIPVYTAIGDNQASFMGAVREKEKSIHITIGTSSQLSVYTRDYIRVDGLETRPFPGGGYILAGAALCGGQSLSVLKSFFEQTVDLFAGGRANDIDFYEVMRSVHYKKSEGDRLLVHTQFNGARDNPSARGSVSNISVSNFTPENLVIGFLKGIVEEVYDFYKAVPPPIKGSRTLLVGSGNAITNNPLLGQMLEERFNMKLTRSPFGEDAAFGACISAMAGGGYRSEDALW